MTRSVILVCALTACGEASRPAPSPSPAAPFVRPACAAEPLPACVDDGFFYCPETVGYPFLGVLPDQDARSSAVASVPAPGTVCLRGTLAAVEGDKTYAQLILGVDARSLAGDCIHSVLDARALGITSMAFDLDQVPDARLFLTAAVNQKAECPGQPYECVAGGTYTLLTRERDDLRLLEPGTNHAAFEDFVGDDSAAPMDTSRLSLFTLRLTGGSRPIEFAFCLSGLAFFDAAGRNVEPPALED